MKITDKIVAIFLFLTFLSGCVESKVEEFLKSIPDPSSLNINIPVYPSPTTFMKIWMHTVGEFNGLFNLVFSVKDYALHAPPTASTEDAITWNSLNSGGSYIYGLFINKTHQGEYNFYIDMAQNVPSPQLYSIAEGHSNEKTVIVVDIKNIHNIDPYTFPDGMSVVIFYEEGSTMPISGIADNFTFTYEPPERGYIYGPYYYTVIKGTKCFQFTREWNYMGELYSLENITGNFCWNDKGGRGEGKIEGEEVGGVLNITECWNANGEILFSKHNEEERGNAGECPF